MQHAFARIRLLHRLRITQRLEELFSPSWESF